MSQTDDETPLQLPSTRQQVWMRDDQGRPALIATPRSLVAMGSTAPTSYSTDIGWILNSPRTGITYGANSGMAIDRLNNQLVVMRNGVQHNIPDAGLMQQVEMMIAAVMANGEVSPREDALLDYTIDDIMNDHQINNNVGTDLSRFTSPPRIA